MFVEQLRGVRVIAGETDDGLVVLVRLDLGNGDASCLCNDRHGFVS